MPKGDINLLYEKAKAELKAKPIIRQDTIVDAVPPPAEDSTPRPPAKVPRPGPKQGPAVIITPLPALELESVPSAAPAPEQTPLPSTYPDSEAPTRVDGKRRLPKPPLTPTPSIHVPLSKEDHAKALATRQWHPPPWLIAIAKWIAPPVMLCLMAGAYWFQAKIALVKEQSEALSAIRQKKDADALALEKSYAESQAKLGLAQAERDAAVAQAAREHLLCTQSAVKVIKEETGP